MISGSPVSRQSLLAAAPPPYDFEERKEGDSPIRVAQGHGAQPAAASHIVLAQQAAAPGADQMDFWSRCKTQLSAWWTRNVMVAAPGGDAQTASSYTKNWITHLLSVGRFGSSVDTEKLATHLFALKDNDFSNLKNLSAAQLLRVRRNLESSEVSDFLSGLDLHANTNTPVDQKFNAAKTALLAIHKEVDTQLNTKGYVTTATTGNIQKVQNASALQREHQVLFDRIHKSLAAAGHDKTANAQVGFVLSSLSGRAVPDQKQFLFDVSKIGSETLQALNPAAVQTLVSRLPLSQVHQIYLQLESDAMRQLRTGLAFYTNQATKLKDGGNSLATFNFIENLQLAAVARLNATASARDTMSPPAIPLVANASELTPETVDALALWIREGESQSAIPGLILSQLGQSTMNATLLFATLSRLEKDQIERQLLGVIESTNYCVGDGENTGHLLRLDESGNPRSTEFERVIAVQDDGSLQHYDRREGKNFLKTTEVSKNLLQPHSDLIKTIRTNLESLEVQSFVDQAQTYREIADAQRVDISRGIKLSLDQMAVMRAALQNIARWTAGFVEDNVPADQLVHRNVPEAPAAQRIISQLEVQSGARFIEGSVGIGEGQCSPRVQQVFSDKLSAPRTNRSEVEKYSIDINGAALPLEFNVCTTAGRDLERIGQDVGMELVSEQTGKRDSLKPAKPGQSQYQLVLTNSGLIQGAFGLNNEELFNLSQYINQSILATYLAAVRAETPFSIDGEPVSLDGIDAKIQYTVTLQRDNSFLIHIHAETILYSLVDKFGIKYPLSPGSYRNTDIRFVLAKDPATQQLQVKQVIPIEYKYKATVRAGGLDDLVQ